MGLNELRGARRVENKRRRDPLGMHMAMACFAPTEVAQDDKGRDPNEADTQHHNEEAVDLLHEVHPDAEWGSSHCDVSSNTARDSSDHSWATF